VTVYVVGYGGYIGKTLYEYLSNKEYEVKGIGRGTPYPMGFKFSDVIINCAARGWKDGDEDPTEIVASNIALPIALDRRSNGALMIHLSSGIELVQPGGSFYAKTKSVASDYLRGKAHILYLYTVFGGKHVQMSRFMTSMIKACAKGEKFTIRTPLHTRDFVHIDHLMVLIESLMKDRHYRTMHVGTGKPVSFIDAYRRLVGIAGREFANVDIDGTDLSSFMYYSPEKTVADTLTYDMKREWELANA